MSAAKSLATPRSPLGFVPWVASVVLVGLCVAGCGASPRGIAVDATTVAHDVVDKATPIVEQKCIAELEGLKRPEWDERTEVCDVVVPAHDALALAVSAAKKAIAVASGAGDLLRMGGELAVQVAEFTAAMVKLEKSK